MGMLWDDSEDDLRRGGNGGSTFKWDYIEYSTVCGIVTVYGMAARFAYAPRLFSLWHPSWRSSLQHRS